MESEPNQGWSVRGYGALQLSRVRARIRNAALVAIILLWPYQVEAQTISGLLIDSETRRGVINGTVTLLDSMGVAVERVLSGSKGDFLIRVSGPGRYTLRGSGLGYRGGLLAPLELKEGDEVNVDIHLLPEPLALEPLEITGTRVREELERQGFWRRREQRSGFFLTPAQLKSRPPVTEAGVLARAPFVYLDRNWTGTRVTMRSAGRECDPAVLVDDMPIPEGAHIEDHVNFADIVALEVYRGFAEIPHELALGLESCGAILIWTVWSELRNKKSGGL